ncbi:MAG: hypothetical protein KDB00_10890 [Planctomycetales bacterium]|nr:hypothetical protein [Planctomycetales bacterium]
MDRDRLDRLTRQSKCCKSGRLETRDLAEGGFLIRVMDLLPDEVTGDRLIPGNVQKGRWWYISPHATDSEVVQTVWLAWKTFHEHELRERFTFYGVPIYHPHQDVERLVDFVATSPRDLRDNTPAKR